MPSFGIPKEIDSRISYHALANNQQDILSWEGTRGFRSGEKVDILGYSQKYSGVGAQDISPNIPEWMKVYCLDVSETMKEKLHELANSIAPEKATNLEKTTQINDYLRNNFTYRDEVKIPDGVDPVDWFLFSGKEGYCNYFASAEVLLLRSVGIPSRIAVGYSQGLKIDNYHYQVRVKDSHAWVEVYFPDAGWVIFEPTPTHAHQKYKELGIENVEIENQEFQSRLPIQIDRETNIPEDILIKNGLSNSR